MTGLWYKIKSITSCMVFIQTNQMVMTKWHGVYLALGEVCHSTGAIKLPIVRKRKITSAFHSALHFVIFLSQVYDLYIYFYKDFDIQIFPSYQTTKEAPETTTLTHSHPYPQLFHSQRQWERIRVVLPSQHPSLQHTHRLGTAVTHQQDEEERMWLSWEGSMTNQYTNTAMVVNDSETLRYPGDVDRQAFQQL